MAQALIMPRQGNTVESCVIVRWKAAEGDRVSADTPVCEVETDKASFELAAGSAGIILKILRAEGDDVPVLEPIAIIGVQGEDWSAAAGAAPTEAPNAAPAAAPSAHAAAHGAAPPAAAAAPSAAPSDAARAAGASPRARRLGAAEGVDAYALAGTGPGGRVIERDVAAAIAARPPLTAAAKAAIAAGGAAFAQALTQAAGTALGGRAGIADLKSVADMKSAAEARGAALQGAVAAPQVAAGVAAAAQREFPGPSASVPLKGVRKLIAERMRASLATTAQLTLDASAPAARLQDLRSRFKASEAALGLSEVTIGDLVLFAVSRVLPRFPYANATLEDGAIRTFERVHLGFAVDTPRGLMVPVIKCADLLALRELSAEVKRLAAACQSGSVNPDDLAGGTFTVTNLGAFGVEHFTPVLNAPQAAILGVSAVVPRPAPGPGGSVVLEPRMGLSLTIDHQAIDGAPGARFLKAVADAIADIDLLLMG